MVELDFAERDRVPELELDDFDLLPLLLARVEPERELEDLEPELELEPDLELEPELERLDPLELPLLPLLPLERLRCWRCWRCWPC